MGKNLVPTAYQVWLRSGRPRPYRHERVAGAGFDLGGFLALALFVIVVSAWLLSARGIVTNLVRFTTSGFTPSSSIVVHEVVTPDVPLELYASVFVFSGSSPDCLYASIDGTWYECSALPLADGIYYLLVRR